MEDEIYKQPTLDEMDEMEEMIQDMVNDPEYKREDWVVPGMEVLNENIDKDQAKCRLERKKLKVLIRSFQLHQPTNYLEE